MKQLFWWAILGSTVVATVIGFILGWVKEYFQEKSRWKKLTYEKLYGVLIYHLLMIRALSINRAELIEEISKEPVSNDLEYTKKKFDEVSPINVQWWQHIQNIRYILESKAGYIRNEHFKIVEDFLDSVIKREITKNGTSGRTTKERVGKIFDSLQKLDEEIIGKRRTTQ
jgi:hypothetical protein